MQRNRLEVVGYLATKPALRYLPSGTPVANVRLGESYRYQDGEGVVEGEEVRRPDREEDDQPDRDQDANQFAQVPTDEPPHTRCGYAVAHLARHQGV